MWTSYSDLFLGLSVIFLLLYVTASLRQGTDGIRQVLENKKLSKEVQDLQQQIKVYETLKQQYLTQEASQDEQSNYEELMDKLTLLQEKEKEEKVKLRDEAKQNEKKEAALNKYQQMIRNIINSNMIAKSRIKSRDNMITNQDTEITGLEKDVQEKSQAITQREGQIGTMQKQLDKKMKELRYAYNAHKITKKKYEQQQAQIKADAEGRISTLKAANDKASQELFAANSQLRDTSKKLNQAQTNVSKLTEENQNLEGELSGIEAKHNAEVNQIKSGFAAQQAKDKSAFEAQIAQEKVSGDQKAAREAAFKAEADRKNKDLATKIADLDKKYRDSQGALAKAQENLNARKNLAKQIKANFAKYGVKADVDMGTGDVLLSFGDEYFATGQANLKPKMRKIIEQAMPAYSASLFENPKVAQKIQSVEIVGFASPTYKGKFVDPSKISADNKQAVNYNLDLSYNRAKSIFGYVFDKDKMSFKYQDSLLPLVKVSGRSFLANEEKRDPASTSKSTTGEDFCKHNDCAKLQKVIIKFQLKD